MVGSRRGARGVCLIVFVLSSLISTSLCQGNAAATLVAPATWPTTTKYFIADGIVSFYVYRVHNVLTSLVGTNAASPGGEVGFLTQEYGYQDGIIQEDCVSMKYETFSSYDCCSGGYCARCGYTGSGTNTDPNIPGRSFQLDAVSNPPCAEKNATCAGLPGTGCPGDCVGWWYSFPAAGKCPTGEPIGTNGCAWQSSDVVRSINYADLISKEGFQTAAGDWKTFLRDTELFVGAFANTALPTVHVLKNGIATTVPGLKFSSAEDGCQAVCGAGTFAQQIDNRPSCVLCPVGSFQNGTNATSCELCPVGMASVVGSVSLSDCFYAVSMICFPGAFSTTGHEPCTPCPLGWYSSEVAALQCTPCPSGTNTSKIGSAGASSCKYDAVPTSMYLLTFDGSQCTTIDWTSPGVVGSSVSGVLQLIAMAWFAVAGPSSSSFSALLSCGIIRIRCVEFLSVTEFPLSNSNFVTEWPYGGWQSPSCNGFGMCAFASTNYFVSQTGEPATIYFFPSEYRCSANQVLGLDCGWRMSNTYTVVPLLLPFSKSLSSIFLPSLFGLAAEGPQQTSLLTLPLAPPPLWGPTLDAMAHFVLAWSQTPWPFDFPQSVAALNVSVSGGRCFVECPSGYTMTRFGRGCVATEERFDQMISGIENLLKTVSPPRRILPTSGVQGRRLVVDSKAKEMFDCIQTPCTLATAMGMAAPGDTIVMTSGVYGENSCGISILRPNITITSASGNPDDVIIDCMKLKKHVIVRALGACISGITFTNGTADGESPFAGSIFVVGADLILRQCVFRGNQAQLGAAISVQHGAIDVFDTLFVGNSATMINTNGDSCGGAIHASGGSVALNNATIIKNRVVGSSTSEARGGAICLLNSSLICLDSHIESNKLDSVEMGAGGGLYSDNSTIVCVSTIFSLNVIASPGTAQGAAIFATNSIMSFVNTDIVNNAISGSILAFGAGMFSSTSRVNFNNGTIGMNYIESTSCTGIGASLWEVSAQMNNSRIVDNIGTCSDVARGAGLSATGGTLTIFSSTITWNQLSSISATGGSLHLESLFFRLLIVQVAHSLSNGSFIASGAGIDAYSSRGVISNLDASANQCVSADLARGCGISLFETHLQMVSSSIRGNSANCTGDGCRSFGAGVFGKQSTCLFSQLEMYYNNACCSGSMCSSSGGAASFVHGSFTLSQVSAASNAAICNGTKCYASAGGIGCDDCNSTVADSTIRSNIVQSTGGHASSGGGGVAVSNNAFLVLRRVEVVGCVALSGGSTSVISSSIGGGLCAVNSNVQIDASLIMGNSATAVTAYGGGVFLLNTHIFVELSNITHNKLSSTFQSFGGGMYLGMSNATILTSLFQNNQIGCSSDTSSCLGKGGAVHSDGSPALSIAAVMVLGNVVETSSLSVSATVSSQGGGISVVDGWANISHSTSDCNIVTCTSSNAACVSEGGGIWIANVHAANILNSFVSNNSAVGDIVSGGGVWIGKSNNVLLGVTSIQFNVISAGTTAGGGGLFLIDVNVSKSNSKFQSIVVYQNTLRARMPIARVYGAGLVSIQCPALSMVSANISNNAIIVLFGSQVALGAGVVIFQNCLIKMSLSVISGNHIQNSVLVGAGGAFFVQGSLSLMRCDVSNNIVSGSGGAIFFNPVQQNRQPRLWCDFVQFSRNEAPVGSALYHVPEEALSQVTLTNLTGSLFALGNAITVSEVHTSRLTLHMSEMLFCPHGAQYQEYESKIQTIATRIAPCTDGCYPIVPSASVTPGHVASLMINCTLCPSNTFSLDRGSARVVDNFCLPCPFAAECSGGATVLATPSYWGWQHHNKSTNQSLLEFFECPNGYCCPNRFDHCAFDYCAGSRVGTLCGGCPSNSGESLFTTTCVQKEHCNSASWFIPLAILLAAGYTFYLGRPSSASAPSGSVSIFLFFMQALPSVRVLSYDRVYQSFLLVIETGFAGGASSQIGGGSGVCVLPGMSAVEKVATGFFEPIVVLVFMLVWKLVTTRRLARWAPSAASVSKAFPLMYNGLMATSLRLLECRPVSGTLRYFFDARIKCPATWQLAPFLLVLILLPSPYLFHVYLLKNKRFSKAADYAQKPYLEHCQWWETVMLYHRVVLLGLFLTWTPLWRGLLITLFSLAMLIIATLFAPFASRRSNRLYVGALASLTMTSILSLPGNAKLSLAATSQFQGSSSNLDGLAWLQFGIIFLTVLILIGHVLHEMFPTPFKTIARFASRIQRRRSRFVTRGHRNHGRELDLFAASESPSSL